MKSRMMSVKIISILLVISLLPLGFAGCGTAFEDLFIGILVEWANAQGVNPTTPGGAVNLAKRTASGSTGDEEADSAIGLIKTIHAVQVGDRLMDEGREERDAAKMDEAIERRPKDWTYRTSRAALAFEQGDYTTAHRQSQEAFTLAVNRGNSKAEKLRYCTQTINELESGNIVPNSMAQGIRDEYYELLENTYGRRYLLTGNEHDNEMRKHYIRAQGNWER
ncbi:MAG: hypothetical protein ABID87_01050 [Chloroflexota bacterium]